LLLAGVALSLVASALAIRYKTRQAEQQNPPQGRFIEVDGVRLHYTERGEGPVLVLLHGNGSMIQDFEISGLVDRAAESYRVIAFDRPGYGHSSRPRGRSYSPQAQAELLARALDRLQIERATVVGHSWGTQVATALALQEPERVQALVLMSGYFFPTLRADVPVLSVPAIPVLGTLVRNTISPWVGRMMWPGLLRILFGPMRTPNRFRAFPLWLALRPSQLRASAAETAMMVPAAFRVRNQYRRLGMPVMIVAGQGDRLVNTDVQSRRLHAELPMSALRIVPEAGHMIHHLALDEVMDAIETVQRPLPIRLATGSSAAAAERQRRSSKPSAFSN